ncbi:hypothetical protein [Streptomyces sp. NPDC018045]|uniref:hypothetical protein n=1 Tax=Streptomyces sp. NPDC018045 TaxID=3365037 RepID=UPI00379530C6
MPKPCRTSPRVSSTGRQRVGGSAGRRVGTIKAAGRLVGIVKAASRLVGILPLGMVDNDRAGVDKLTFEPLRGEQRTYPFWTVEYLYTYGQPADGSLAATFRAFMGSGTA